MAVDASKETLWRGCCINKEQYLYVLVNGCLSQVHSAHLRPTMCRQAHVKNGLPGVLNMGTDAHKLASSLRFATKNTQIARPDSPHELILKPTNLASRMCPLH
jgi:hypothetical protein